MVMKAVMKLVTEMVMMMVMKWITSRASRGSVAATIFSHLSLKVKS